MCEGGSCRLCAKILACKEPCVEVHTGRPSCDVQQRLEAAGILDECGLIADILVRDAALLVARPAIHNSSQIEIDTAVVNALGNNHWDKTQQAGRTEQCLQKRERIVSRRGPLCGRERRRAVHCRDPIFLVQAFQNSGSSERLSHEVVGGRLATGRAACPRCVGDRAFRLQTCPAQ